MKWKGKEHVEEPVKPMKHVKKKLILKPKEVHKILHKKKMNLEDS
jgi:hypothetical protein